MKGADYLVASTGDLYLVRLETKFFRKEYRLAIT